MTPRTAEEVARAAKKAFEASGLITSEERSTALLAVRAELEQHKDAILEANQKDMAVGLHTYWYTGMYHFLQDRFMCRPPMNK